MRTSTVTSDPPRRRRRLARRLTTLLPTMTIGALLWVLLWGELSWANVVYGAALGALTALAFPLPALGTSAKLRIGPLLHLLGRFVGDLVLASFQVAWAAVVPGPTPRGGLVSVPLRTTSELFVATTAGLSSLVPGSLVIDMDRESRTLRLHVLDLDRSGGPEAVRASTQALETRLLRAFASDVELARVGLTESFRTPAVTSRTEESP